MPYTGAMSTTPRTPEQHSACVREFRTLSSETYADGAIFLQAIETFLATHGAVGLEKSAGPGASELFDLCYHALDYEAPSNKTHTRKLLSTLARLSKWAGHDETTDIIALTLLKEALLAGQAQWARALLEASPPQAARPIYDFSLYSAMRFPDDDQTGDWQWTMERLTHECLGLGETRAYYSIDGVNNANALLALAHLWRANGERRTSTVDMADEKVEWMARHRETLGRRDEEIVNRFLAGWRRERLAWLSEEGDGGPGRVEKTRPLRM